MRLIRLLLISMTAAVPLQAQPAAFPTPVERQFVVRDFRLQSGQALPEVRIHYRTIGEPVRDNSGQITNAVLLLHGSSGDATQLMAASFSRELFGAGEPLDASRFFLILPDGLGNGKSTKPSDGLRARFPKYGYSDMVELEHRLVTEGLGIRRLRLVMGISMGGMHAWMWGIRYPDAMDGLIPIAAQPSPIEGRNLVWRRILSQAIRKDPEWKNGDYTEQPRGFRSIMPMFDMLVQSPVRMSERIKSYADADGYLDDVDEETLEEDDANNILFRFEASFDYNPVPDLARIRAPLMTILFADDELNPLDAGSVAELVQRVPRGRLVVVPAGPATEGHRTQVRAAVWKRHVAEFLSGLPRR